MTTPPLIVLGLALTCTALAPGGETLDPEWVRIWGPGSGGSSTGGLGAVAPDGSVYVTGRFGESGDDIVLVHYDAQGRVLWERTYDGPAGGNDGPTDLELTPDGVSLVGASPGERGPETVLLDYADDGTLIRERRTLGPAIPGFLQPQLAIGADGRRVVATDDGAGAAVVEAYSSDGDLIFRTPMTLSGFSGVSALALNDALDAFVVVVEDFARYVVHKFDAAGEAQWSHTESFAGLVIGDAHLVPIGDDVVVVGSGEPPCISPKVRVWRHADDGVVRWTTELPDECAFAVAVGMSRAPEGGVYVAASATLPGSFLARLDANGGVSWVTEAGGEGDSIGFRTMATGPAGEAVIGGSIAPEASITAFDVLVQSYGSDGALQWSSVYGGSAGEADFINDVAVGSDGRVVAIATVDAAAAPQSLATISFAGGSCPGDLDGSGDVGAGDLLAMLAAWGEADHPADLDHDGVVDLPDLLILLSSWGACD